MGQLLYGRRFSAIISTDAGQGLEFASFRCRFEIRRGDYQNPNSIDMRVYNVAPATVNTLRAPEFTNITVKAGFGDETNANPNYGQVFAGNIKQVRYGRVNQKDSYIDITAGDSDRAYNFATVSQSIPRGATPSQVQQLLIAAGKQFGVDAGYAPDFPAGGATRGQAFVGAWKDSCRTFAAQNECSWSIQDGKLTFIPLTSYIPSGGQVTLSPSTGLIGTPEQIANGISMRCLLNPSIKIGTAIKLENTTINQYRYGLDLYSVSTSNIFAQQSNQVSPSGIYYVLNVSYVGDTRGKEWYSDLICLSIDATVPPDQNAQALTAIDQNPRAIKIFD